MLKIRLRRMGARHSPFYRVVVSDSRNVPTASAVEELGHYNPTSNPPQVKLDAERVRQWVAKGAQLSPTVKRLLALHPQTPQALQAPKSA
jgi:small subunit ribosomal protein S16